MSLYDRLTTIASRVYRSSVGVRGSFAKEERGESGNGVELSLSESWLALLQIQGIDELTGGTLDLRDDVVMP